MSDRRAVSAGHLGASSVAAANDAWRVAVGGNRVESMTAAQIAHAFHNGQLNVRTPLWPPGSTGWQALGNFSEFQTHPAAYGASAGLAQFEEADDDPTRMWTGGNELDLAGMEAAMQMQPPPAPQQARPSARTGTRQVAAPRAPYPSQPAPSQQQYAQQQYAQQQYAQQPQAQQPYPSQSPPGGYSAPVAAMPPPSRPSPTASVASRTPALVPSTPPSFRSNRNGLWLVAGLVGLVGLGSAVLAARGNWGSASQAAAAEVAAAPETPTAEASGSEPASSESPTSPEKPVGEAQLAKYEDKSAFVAGEAAKPSAAEPSEPAAAANAEAPPSDTPTADATDAKREAEDAEKANDTDEADAPDERKAAKSSARTRNGEAKSKRVRSRAARKRAAAAAAPRRKPAPRARAVEKADKPDKPEKAVASSQQAPASADVNEAAAAALGNSAELAASCRPRGGPSGQGKARVIYSNDGEVQSVEILTAKFRDTLTGSCVRMVFRRAKIPAFKGDPPTFIKSFTIPED